MYMTTPKQGQDLADWQATLAPLAQTPIGLTGVPTQSFQDMQLGPSQPGPSYMPTPQQGATNPLQAILGGAYDARINSLQSRNDQLGTQMADARGQITSALGQYQQDIAQPVDPFQMPQQQGVNPATGKALALGAILGVILGARGGVANQALGTAYQGLNKEADTQNAFNNQQAQYDYQAKQQTRQQKLQGELAGVSKFQNVLEGLGAEYNNNTRQIDTLTNQKEVNQTRRDNAAQTNQWHQDQMAQKGTQFDRSLLSKEAIAAQKTPAAQAQKSLEMAQAAAQDPANPFYGDPEGAKRWYGYTVYKAQADTAHVQSIAEKNRALLKATLDRITAQTGKLKIDTAKIADDLKWSDQTHAADIASKWAHVDDVYNNHADALDSKAIDSAEKDVNDTIDTLQSERKAAISNLDKLQGELSKAADETHQANLEQLIEAEKAHIEGLATEAIPGALERRAKVQELRKRLADQARARSTAPKQTGKGQRPQPLPGSVPLSPSPSDIVPSAPPKNGK